MQKRDFLGNRSLGSVIKIVVVTTILASVFLILVVVFLDERNKVLRDYEEDYVRYNTMGCASKQRQTEKSRLYCESVEDIVRYPVWANAAIYTAQRLYPCESLYCSDVMKPMGKTLINLMLTGVLCIGFALFVYFVCFGKFSWGGQSSQPQVIHMIQQPPQPQSYVPHPSEFSAFSRPYPVTMPGAQYSQFPALPASNGAHAGMKKRKASNRFWDLESAALQEALD